MTVFVFLFEKKMEDIGRTVNELNKSAEEMTGFVETYAQNAKMLSAMADIWIRWCGSAMDTAERAWGRPLMPIGLGAGDGGTSKKTG